MDRDRYVLPNPLQPTDLTDDRLAALLHAPTTVRVDSTTANGYWEVTEDGLFQFGHSKDHRPDLPQLNVMLATLDPLVMPVVVDVVPGQRNDEPLYLPIIERVRASV